MSVLGLVGSAVSGVASLMGGNDQADAAADALKLQKKIYGQTVNRMLPYYEAGAETALPAYLFEMGLGERPEGYGGIEMSPAAQFALTEGRDTIEAGAAGRGGLFSGSTLKGLERYRTDLARSDRDNQLNRMLGVVNSGQNAAGNLGAMGANFASNASNAMMQGANATSAGYMGLANAVNSGIDNYLQYQTMNRMVA